MPRSLIPLLSSSRWCMKLKARSSSTFRCLQVRRYTRPAMSFTTAAVKEIFGSHNLTGLLNFSIANGYITPNVQSIHFCGLRIWLTLNDEQILQKAGLRRNDTQAGQA